MQARWSDVGLAAVLWLTGLWFSSPHPTPHSIVRAFLIEEQKIVKRMVKSQPAAAAPAKKSKSKKTAKK